MKFVLRGIPLLILYSLSLALHLSAQEPLSAPPQSGATPAYEISGSARSGKTPLPGATVIASNTLTGKKYTVVTNAEGKFSLSGIARGRYVVRIEFMGFAVFTQDLVVNPENPAGKIEAELILASRQQQQSPASSAGVAAGRGFQSLAVDTALSSLAGGNSGAGNSGLGQSGADLNSLPLNGAGADGPTESISVSGAQGRTQDFGAGSEDELQERVQEFRDRMQRQGGSGFGGGAGQGPGGGGGPGGGAGGGPIAIGRLGGRGFNVNQPHGVLYFSDDNSALDATPYSLSGFPTAKSEYNQSHFGANVGGPLNIPKIFNGGNKWFFFFGWNASRGDTPYDSFSRVPTLAERNGDFSNATYNDGTPVQLFNPVNGQQYQFNGVLNQIDQALFSPASKDLLQYIPFPNIPANRMGQNFHYITSDNNSSDAVILRLIHNLGSASGAPMGPFGGGGGGGGRGGGGRRQQNNINFGLNWTRTNTNLVNSFPVACRRHRHAGTQCQRRVGPTARIAPSIFCASTTITITSPLPTFIRMSPMSPDRAAPESPAFPMTLLTGDCQVSALRRSAA